MLGVAITLFLSQIEATAVMQHQIVSTVARDIRPEPFKRVAVLGAGSWRTAVAATFARAGVSTRIWGRDRQVINAINAQSENTRYLPGVAVPEALWGVHDIRAALDGVEAVAIVVPSR